MTHSLVENGSPMDAKEDWFSPTPTMKKLYLVFSSVHTSACRRMKAYARRALLSLLGRETMAGTCSNFYIRVVRPGHVSLSPPRTLLRVDRMSSECPYHVLVVGAGKLCTDQPISHANASWRDHRPAYRPGPQKSKNNTPNLIIMP